MRTRSWSISGSGTCARYTFHIHLLYTSPSRQTNLALLQNYGSNAWRVHNYQLESTAKLLDKTVEDLKQLTVEVNRERKNSQVSFASMFPTELDADHKAAYSRQLLEPSSRALRPNGQSLSPMCCRSRWPTSPSKPRSIGLTRRKSSWPVYSSFL